MRLRSPPSRPLVLTGLCVLLAATSATRAQSTWPGTATPLGACIRRVFRGATFPRADRDHEINVRIHPS